MSAARSRTYVACITTEPSGQVAKRQVQRRVVLRALARAVGAGTARSGGVQHADSHSKAAVHRNHGGPSCRWWCHNTMAVREAGGHFKWGGVRTLAACTKAAWQAERLRGCATCSIASCNPRGPEVLLRRHARWVKANSSGLKALLPWLPPPHSSRSASGSRSAQVPSLAWGGRCHSQAREMRSARAARAGG